MDQAPALYIIRINGHQPALYGVLAEIDALGLDLLEVRQLPRTANHRDQVRAAHRDGHYRRSGLSR